MDSTELFKQYLNLSYRYLTIRNRSEKEVRDYLTRKNANSEIIEQIIASLKNKKFINDELFARSWVVNRARLKPKGEIILKIELRQKGIPDAIINKVLDEVQDEIPDELEQAKQLISKRMDRMVGYDRREVYQKVGGFLSRRGFNWEIVKKAIDSYLE